MAVPGGVTDRQRAVEDLVAARLPKGPLVVALGGGADSAVCAWASSPSTAIANLCHSSSRPGWRVTSSRRSVSTVAPSASSISPSAVPSSVAAVAKARIRTRIDGF